MQPRYRGVLLVLLASLLATAAQILFKRASATLVWNPIGLIANADLVAGFIIYGLVALIFVTALKDGELTILYPVLAMNYVWTSIAAPLLFPEDSLNILKVAGIVLIVAGVSAIGRGMQHPAEAA